MKAFQIQLSCTAATALKRIRARTDPADGFRLLRHWDGAPFWSDIQGKKVRIWPKGAMKDLSAVYVTGRVSERPGGALFAGNIVDSPVGRFRSWLVIGSLMLLPFALLYAAFCSGVGSDPDGVSLVLTLAVASVTLYIVCRRASRGQVEDLARFLADVFGDDARAIRYE